MSELTPPQLPTNSLPSRFLPHLPRQISKTLTSSDIVDYIQLLRKIFLPPILGSGKEITDSGYNTEAEDASPSGEEQDEEPAFVAVRADEFEQQYARDWVLMLIKKGDEWVEECGDEDEGLFEGHEGDEPVAPERTQREHAISEAAALLAIWSGTSASGAIVRSLQLSPSISVDINDAPYDAHTPDSVGVQTWGSSVLLARRIIAQPESFHLSTKTTAPTTRILELGAGTGVCSLACAALAATQRLPWEIVATDYNPLVLQNLNKNILINHPAPSPLITSCPLDWLSFYKATSQSDPLMTVGRDGTRIRPDQPLDILDPPLDHRFHVILGADIVYEAHMPAWIKSTVEKFLEYPAATRAASSAASADNNARTNGGLFFLWVPLRPTHTKEIQAIEKTFLPFEEVKKYKIENGIAEWKLAVLDREELVRVPGVGRADETCYRFYSIGWI